MLLFISVELAFSRPNMFLEYSITAICIPKQIPKKGMLFSLAYFTALIFPSIPLSPKPGATKIPFTPSSFFAAFLGVKPSECTQRTFTFVSLEDPA